jgi:hypothetical protein
MTPLDPDERALSRSTGSMLSSWRLKLCLGKENAGESKIFFFFLIESTEILSPCKKSSGKTIGAPKTASGGETPVSSLGYAQRPISTQGISSAQVAAVVRARGVSLRQL